MGGAKVVRDGEGEMGPGGGEELEQQLGLALGPVEIGRAKNGLCSLFIRGRDRASRNSEWSYQYTNVQLPRNFNCAYIHHCRNWVQAFPSPFSSMDSWRIRRSAVRSTNSYLYIYLRDVWIFQNSMDMQKRNAIPTRTKTSLWLKVYCDPFVQITIKVKQGQEQRISLW